ncbi:MAG: nuclear transport factor 2 family protein [Dehalococcoidia bacterium]
MNPSPDLRDRLLALYRAMSSGDADAVEAFYSLEAGSVFIGTGDAEFWTDSARHNADVRHFFDGRSGVISWNPGDALSLVEGSVGWTVDRPTLYLPSAEVLRLRLSLVWRREDGVWKVVHSHASLGPAPG